MLSKTRMDNLLSKKRLTNTTCQIFVYKVYGISKVKHNQCIQKHSNITVTFIVVLPFSAKMQVIFFLLFKGPIFNSRFFFFIIDTSSV